MEKQSSKFPGSMCSTCLRPYDTPSKGVQQSAFNRQVGGSYYKQFKIEPYKFFFENKITHEKAAIIRRILRYDAPDGKGLQDLEKIQHECDLIKELMGYIDIPDEEHILLKDYFNLKDLLQYVILLLNITSTQLSDELWNEVQVEAIDKYNRGVRIDPYFEKPEELK